MAGLLGGGTGYGVLELISGSFGFSGSIGCWACRLTGACELVTTRERPRREHCETSNDSLLGGTAIGLAGAVLSFLLAASPALLSFTGLAGAGSPWPCTPGWGLSYLG
jgi:hypothetical protein